MNCDIQNVLQQILNIFQKNSDCNLPGSEISMQQNSSFTKIEQDKVRKNINGDDINDEANHGNHKEQLRKYLQYIFNQFTQDQNKNQQQQQIPKNIEFIKNPSCFNSPKQANQEQQPSIEKQKDFMNKDECQEKSEKNRNALKIEADKSKEKQQYSELKNSSKNENLQKSYHKRASNSISKHQEVVYITSDDEHQDVDKTPCQKNSFLTNNNRFFQSQNQKKKGLSQICQNSKNKQQQCLINKEEVEFCTTVYVGSAYHMKNNSVYFYKIVNSNINSQDSFKFYYFEEDFEQERMFDIVKLMLSKVSNYNINKINLIYSLGEQSLILMNIFNQSYKHKKEIYNQKKKQIFEIISQNNIAYTQYNAISQKQLENIYFENLQIIKKWPNQTNKSKQNKKQWICREEEYQQNSDFENVNQEKSYEIYMQNSLKEYQYLLRTKQKIPSNNPYYIMSQARKHRGYDEDNFLSSSPHSDAISQNSTPQNKKRRAKSSQESDEDEFSDYSNSLNQRKNRHTKSYKKVKNN
ncbi:hypothetical protein ABPG72_021829 [Tetrahymena utriculariae]